MCRFCTLCRHHAPPSPLWGGDIRPGAGGPVDRLSREFTKKAPLFCASLRKRNSFKIYLDFPEI